MHVLYFLFRLCSALSCGRMLLSRADTVTDIQYASVNTSYRRKIADVLFDCFQVVIAPYIVVKYSYFVLQIYLMHGICSFHFHPEHCEVTIRMYLLHLGNRDSVVGIVARLWAGDSWFET